MPTIALTGATGFVGRAVLKQLLADGHRVRALARPSRRLLDDDNLVRVPGTLEDADRLAELVKDCHAVVHVAGAISGRDYADFAHANVAGTARLVDAIQKKASTARLIHVSSLAAREPQLSDYAASKRAGEDIVTASGLKWGIIRPPAVYGPDDPALAPVWRLLAHGWLPCIGTKAGRFSLLHVADLATAIGCLVTSSQSDSWQTCLHDGKPGGYSWRELADVAARVRNGKVRIVTVPRWMLKPVARLNLQVARLRRARPPALVPGKLRELAHSDWVCDNTQLPGCPEWKPSMQLKNCLTDLPGWSRFR
ncbi:MAG: NAD-dependent epimerase/dehydratase family protein [Wenzhouxiangella sp.]